MSQKLHIHNEFHRFSRWRWNNYCSVSPLHKEWSENSHTTKLLEFKQFKNEMTLCHTSITVPCLQTQCDSDTAQAVSEVPQFASKICFFQIWDTHTFLKRKYTEDTAVVGKKKNSDWVYGTWSARMILARRCLLFHNWNNVFLAQIPEMKGLHRYSKGSRICKWTASPKRQKKYPTTDFLLSPSQKNYCQC